MPNNLRDDSKIQKMREGGKILANILKTLMQSVKPGITTAELDRIAEDQCHKNHVIPAFKGYSGFPASLCVGVNDVVVHGIPSDDEILQEGDIISLDFGIVYQKTYLDMARTVGVGKIDGSIQHFLEVVAQSLQRACEVAITGNTVGDIGYTIQSNVEKQGFSVVREMVGHSIGYKLHEDPFIPGYGEKGFGPKLYDGQTVAIESIINQGLPDILISREDGWTTRTKDGKLSALFENTVLVGKKPEILTPLPMFL